MTTVTRIGGITSWMTLGTARPPIFMLPRVDLKIGVVLGETGGCPRRSGVAGLTGGIDPSR